MPCPFSSHCSFRKPQLIPLLFLVASLMLFIALGVWQLHRLEQKNTLVAAREAARQLPALSTLPSAPHEGAWRAVTLTGTYLGGDRTLRFIGRSSNGYVLYTPLRIEDSDQVVLIDRGLVGMNDPVTPPEGVQTVQGYLREPREKRLFSPDNRPDRNLWFVEDMPAMEEATGTKLAPYIVAMEPLPLPRNDHLGYAITWFLLAGAAVIMFGAYHCEKKIKP